MIGTRLKPSEMYQWASYNLNKASNRAIVSIEKKYLYEKIQYEKQSFFLLKPACDDAQITIASAGTETICDILLQVKHLQEQGNFHNSFYIIPYAECRNRQHWTLLIINELDCYFFDPKKSALVAGYDLSFTENYLQDKSYQLLSKNYTALQSFFDGTHCGYIVGYIIYYVINQLIKGYALDTIKPQDSLIYVAELVQEYNRKFKNADKKNLISSDLTTSVISQHYNFIFFETHCDIANNQHAIITESNNTPTLANNPDTTTNALEKTQDLVSVTATNPILSVSLEEDNIIPEPELNINATADAITSFTQPETESASIEKQATTTVDQISQSQQLIITDNISPKSLLISKHNSVYTQEQQNDKATTDKIITFNQPETGSAPIEKQVTDKVDQISQSQQPILNDNISGKSLLSSKHILGESQEQKNNFFDKIIKDKSFWKSLTHLGFKQPHGITLMQGKSFVECKKIAKERKGKQNLFFLFCGYNSRHLITDIFYQALIKSSCIEELNHNPGFEQVLNLWKTYNYTKETKPLKIKS